MPKLSSDRRAAILTLLCEGDSLRAIARITGVSLDTVTKLLIDAGKACHAFHDRAVQNVRAKHVRCDEIWIFPCAKQKNVVTAKAAPEGAGDTWTWTALDADSKLIVSWLVGGRDAGSATEFMRDVASRLANRVQLTTDGHNAYLEAVEDAFDADVDYAQLVKLYGSAPESFKGCCSLAECTGAIKTRVEGGPDAEHVNTSYVERQNLTMRMHTRRFTRLTNGFSKKVETDAYAVALHFTFYNFARIHKSLRVTPAMAAGISNRLWDMHNIVALVEAAEAQAKPKVRGPYKTKARMAAEAGNSK